MTITELNNLLQITEGNLILSATTLPNSNFDNLLSQYNNGNPITIKSAEKTLSDTKIVVIGNTSFLKVDHTVTTATFTIDSDGNPQVIIKCLLIGSTAAQNAWKFSQSFGSLPPFYFSNVYSNYLDSLKLTNTYFLLCTSGSIDSTTGQILEMGLNFYSSLDPSGVLGIFEAIISSGDTIILQGQINIPDDNTSFPPLPYGEFPWNSQLPVPGINLSADLGVNINLSDQLKIYNTILRFYSPISSAWLYRNKTYQPVVDIEGTLSIPSLNTSVTVDATVNPQKNITSIIGSFEGVNFKNLIELTDLSNGGGLSDVLPEKIQEQLRELENLTLERLGMTITGSLNPSSIDSINIMVGLPGLTWNPVSTFTVSEIASEFIITNPFANGRQISLALKATLNIASTPFSVLLRAPDFMLAANIQRDATIPLKSIFETYLSELPAPPDLVINDMSFASDLSNDSFDFYITLAADPGWTLNVPKPLTIFDVRIDVSKNQQTQASFAGSLEFADNVISVSYTMPGDLMVRGDFPKINVTDLISELCDNTITFPSGFDLELIDSTILIEQVQSQDTFFFATQVDNYGVFVFQAVRANNQTGLAFGFELGSQSLSSINGLSVLKPLEDFFQLSDLMLLVTSVDPTHISFPDLDKFQNPSITSKKINLPTQSGSNEGFYAYANVAFDTTGGQGTLSKLFGLTGQLGMVLFIGEQPAKNAKFYININFTGHSGVLNGCTLNAQLGALISNGDPAMFLLGNLSAYFGSQQVIFTTELLVVPNGAFISGTIQGSLPSFNLTDSLSITFSQLALEVGVDLEGIPSFGFMGQIDTNNGFDSSVAIFLDSAEPAKSLLAGAVSDINLYDIVSVFSQNTSEELPEWLCDLLKEIGVAGINSFTIDKSYAFALDNLDLHSLNEAFALHDIVVSTNIQQSLLVTNVPGEIWSLTTIDNTTGVTHYQLKVNNDIIQVELEAQLYLAPQSTAIGNINLPQGFKAIGSVSIFFFELISNTEILPSSGIKINEEIEAVNWKIADVEIFKLSGANGSGNPTLSMSTFTDNTQVSEDLKGPHFLLDGEISFLDIDNISAYVNIRKEGLNFNLNNKYFLIDLNVNGTFTKLSDFSVNGSASFAIGNLDLGPAGTVPIDTGINSALGISVSDNSGNLNLGANVSLAIEILGDQFSLVNIAINISESFFENLPDTIEKLLIDEILKEPLKWLSWIKNGLVSIGDNVVQVLKDVFGISSWQDVANLMNQVGYAFSDIVNGIVSIFGVASSDVWNFLISLAKTCAIDSVNALTGDSTYSLFNYSQGFLSRIGGTEDAQRLLFLYYSNQEELQNTLIIHKGIWQEYIMPENQQLLLSNPVLTIITYLDKIKAVCHKDMTGAIDDSITILSQYENFNYEDLLKKLN